MTCFKISYTCELTVVQTTSRTMITLYAIVLQAYVTIVLGLIQTLQKKDVTVYIPTKQRILL